jgi:DNA (cytosine-5)-methyltransferase 1
MGWHHLGWEPAFFSDIDPFPRAVLSHHYPDIPLHGDFTTIGEDDYGSIELLVGGTPCQSFSVAGLRGGMDDDRGNLALEYLKLAQRKRPKWLVWENVPGVLSSNGGRDFGAFLGGMVELGYGFAYRICDAQYFGLAQRRRRVFVVGYLGDWRRAAAVLFERESLSGNPPPRRETGERVAPAVTTGPPFSRTGNERVEADAMVPVFPTLDASMDAKFGSNQWVDSGQWVLDDVSKSLMAHGVRLDPETESFIAFHPTQTPISNKDVCHAIGANPNATAAVAVYTPETANCLSASPSSNTSPNVASGQGDVIAFSAYNQSVETDDVSQTIAARNDQDTASCVAVAFAQNSRDELRESPVVGALSTGGGKPGQGYHAVRENMKVRRLTPRECERLQGFPDDFTKIPYRNKPASDCPDGPRYKALGNSMAVPVMKWIGERIEKVTRLTE